MHSKTLLVKCKRGDLGTDYAYFVVGHWDGLHFDPVPCQRKPINAVKIVYSVVHQHALINKTSEVLPFKEYEEAALLHDGCGWNLNEISAWVSGLEIPGDLNDPHRYVTDNGAPLSVTPASETDAI